MKISLCVIAKNEESNLPACLDSVADIVAEKIVVDTGSTDKTVELAKQHGARVRHFTWNNNFSDARNYALSAAKGEWVLFLDADEKLTTESKETIATIVKKAERDKADVIVGLMTNYDCDAQSVQSVFKCARLFKNDPTIRYVGAIHEDLSCSSRSMRVYDATKLLKFVHTGYSPQEVKRQNKVARNTALSMAEVQRDPHNGTAWFYLSQTLISTTPHKALEAAKKVVECHNLAIPYLYAINYINMVNLMIGLNADKADVTRVLDEALRECPDTPDFYFWQAEMLSGEGRCYDALQKYHQAIARLQVESPSYRSLTKRLFDMGELYYALARRRESVKYFIEALKNDKFYADALRRLIEVLAADATSTATMAGVLQPLYGGGRIKEQLFVLQVALQAAHAGLAELYLNLFSPAQQEELQLEAQLIAFLKGNHLQAAEALVKLLPKSRPVADFAKYAFYCALLLSKRAVPTSGLESEGALTDVAVLNKLMAKKAVENEEERQFCLRIVGFAMRGRCFEALVRRHPWLVDFGDWCLYAKLAASVRRFDLAVQLYARFLQTNEAIEERELGDILAATGECLYAEENNGAALQCLQDAHRLGVTTYHSYEIALAVLCGGKKRKEAAVLAKTALEHYPDSQYLQEVLRKCEE